MMQNPEYDRVRNVVSEHLDALGSKQMTISQFANRLIIRMCARCSHGHPAWRNEQFQSYEHGVDLFEGSEVYANPEPCVASAVHELLYEMREG